MQATNRLDDFGGGGAFGAAVGLGGLFFYFGHGDFLMVNSYG